MDRGMDRIEKLKTEVKAAERLLNTLLEVAPDSNPFGQRVYGAWDALQWVLKQIESIDSKEE